MDIKAWFLGTWSGSQGSSYPQICILNNNSNNLFLNTTPWKNMNTFDDSGNLVNRFVFVNHAKGSFIETSFSMNRTISKNVDDTDSHCISTDLNQHINYFIVFCCFDI